MKWSDLSGPTPIKAKRDSERARRSEQVGIAWQWAHAAENEDNPIAPAVRVVLAEAQRLADRTAAVEMLRVDNRILRTALGAYRRRDGRTGRG